MIGRRVLEALPEAAVSGVTKRWVAVDIYPTPDGGLSVAFRDIQERKRAEERQRLLIDELTHRIKNTLAIAEQTRRTVSSPDAFHAVFRDRLAALARAHDVLRRDGGTETTLDVVAREALAPYLGGGSPRVEIVGPEVRLPSGAAVTLGMAFHELATNAAKYGALSTPGGRVRLSWHQSEYARDEPRSGYDVLWQESGGPPITGPPQRRGFGTRLLEGGLAAQIGGEVSLDFAATGLRCRITLGEFADERVETDR